jgi:Fanconi anemia group M protein
MEIKPIYSIFSKSRILEKKEYAKPKIIIDYREKNSLVASELIKLGFEIEFKELKVADYLINHIAIERKTVSDFISSMINGRLTKQLEELQQYEDKLLLIEGFEERELYSDDSQKGVSSNAVRGFLLSILLKHKIPIIFAKNSEDTARFIDVLSRKKEKESPLNVTKKSLDKRERLQFILEGFPGIGPKTAKKLLEKFKTLRNISNVPIEEITQVIGKKADIFKLVEEEY